MGETSENYPEIKFCYPEDNIILEEKNYYRIKNNKEKGYIDLSDANVSDYIYDAMKCMLFSKMLDGNISKEKAEKIKELLDDIVIFNKHIYLVSVRDNYSQHRDLLNDDLEQIYEESKNISERFIEFFRG